MNPEDTRMVKSFIDFHTPLWDELCTFIYSCPELVDFNSVSAFGEGGDDLYLVKRLNSTSHIIGGAGHDLVDYSRSETGAWESVGDYVDGIWGGGSRAALKRLLRVRFSSHGLQLPTSCSTQRTCGTWRMASI